MSCQDDRTTAVGIPINTDAVAAASLVNPDDSLADITENLLHMLELAQLSASLAPESDRTALQLELDCLRDDVDRIADNFHPDGVRADYGTSNTNEIVH